MSGWQDSNLRPSAPKADALTGLRYTPKCKLGIFVIAKVKINFTTTKKYLKTLEQTCISCGERGIRTPGTVVHRTPV